MKTQSRFLLIMLIQSLTTVSLSQQVPSDELKIRGFDPKFSTVFERLDPGERNQVLASNGRRSSVDTNACDPVLSTELIKTYEDYERVMSQGYIFASAADEVTIPEGSRDKGVVRHFQDGGEIVLHQASCETYFDEYTSDSITNIDQHFLSTLVDLGPYFYHMDTDLAKSAVEKFVAAYGTHYVKKRYFGASIVVQVRLPKKSTPELLRNLDFTVNEFFNGKQLTKADIIRIVCDEVNGTCGYPEIKIATKGPIPLKDLKSWRADVEQSPAVIRVEIEKFTSLLKDTNFNNLLKQTLTGMKKEDPSIQSMKLEGFENIARVLDFHDYLHIGETCPKPDFQPSCSGPSTLLSKSVYTKLDNHFDSIIVSGGRRYNENLTSVITIGKIKSLPDLPEAEFGHSLVALNNGEINQAGRTGLWRINYLDEEIKWDKDSYWHPSIQLAYFSSINFKFHSSGSGYLSGNILYSVGPSGNIEQRTLPFKALDGHCSVNNNQDFVVIGAGEERNEIWVGSSHVLDYGSTFYPMDVLPFGRRGHKCLWVGTEIFVTGGNVGTPESPSFVNTVDIIDTLNGRVRSGGHLLSRRANHGIIRWQGRPTVIGGQVQTDDSRTPSLAASDEYFDEQSGTWKELAETFGLNRHSFGLVQFYAAKEKPFSASGHYG